MKQFKKYLIYLFALALLTPIGIFLPHYFNAGDAWGEWSPEYIKENTGIEPSGMKNTAELYKAPLPDYNLGNEDDPLAKLYIRYIISGIIGTAIILLLTFSATKLFHDKKKE